MSVPGGPKDHNLCETGITFPQGVNTDANDFGDPPRALHVPMVCGYFEHPKEGIHSIKYVTPYDLDVLDLSTPRTHDNDP